MQCEKIRDYIVQWLKEYLNGSGCKGFVVGVSGGVDSALTSTLCAWTGFPVIALTLPIHQHRDHVDRAAEHISWLNSKFSNVTHYDIDLSPAFEELKKCVPKQIHDDLTLANARSRLRMVTLYMFAGHHRMLVAGTGNKVEDFGVGFFTKYGDGGVDLSPIADLYKSQVYELAAFLGINEKILKAPPSDGLFNDEFSDEDQIGASYDELEWAMEYEKGKITSTPLSDRQKTVLEIYRKRHRANQHKMHTPPVCLIPEEWKK